MSASADVRAFYEALGIDLPQWANANATVRCFASPNAHAHNDRTPSCSVSLEHGAWRCWACGACGGPYDAALARGHTQASAIDLMVEYGLTERRGALAGGRPPRVRMLREPPRNASPSKRSVLQVTDADVERWHRALFSAEHKGFLELLCRQRLWRPATLHQLELGYDRGRITIPIRSGRGELRGVLRYQPGSATRKVLAVAGSRLGLIPHPSTEPSPRLLLVEGPPDMIAARSRGWPAIAVPGDHAWRPEWGALFRSRQVTVLMDCDSPGRAAAQRIAADLSHLCPVRVIDLAPDRHDGFDLTDWLRPQPQPRRASCKPSSSSKPTITP